MNSRTPLALFAVCALSFAMTSCAKKDSNSTQGQAATSDHDHADDPGHDHADDHGHDHADDHSHDHADAISKTIDIAGNQLVISIEGTVTANAELHVEITAANADEIKALRLWFGTQSGEDSLKTKADNEGDHWHAHVECPSTIPNDSSLWIEIEDANGTRLSKAVPLS
ncbi:MAG: hypothetical protein P8J86_02960 [Phycisphaerales bacterium]|nr:hypothetical protein [Phycisphaerales bacterium]